MGDFYCTTGRGMEYFCHIELQRLQATLHGGVEGKLFFSLPDDHQHPIILRTAERIFISAFHGKQMLDGCSRAVAAFKLQQLLAEQIPWSDCIATWRTYNSKAPNGPLPFRINVRVTGSWRRILQPISIARSFSQRVCNSSDLFKPCLNNPLVVIDLHISDTHITAGIALTLSSQALRGPSYGLRSTTANAMAMCLHMNTNNLIKKQSIILDPMCGKGSILNELTNYTIIGIDNDQTQLSFAKENVCNANLILGDATHLPLKSQSIDHIVCDIPFGNQYSTQNELQHLLPNVIQEMKRVIKPSGAVVLLICVDQLTTVNKIIQNEWTFKNKFELSLGLIEAVICVYVFNN